MARPKSNGSSTSSSATIGFEADLVDCMVALTDMVRNFDGAGALIEQWLKNKDTVLFLGVWERINNPGFNSLKFEGIRNEAGRKDFSVGQKMNHPDWVRRVQN